MTGKTYTHETMDVQTGKTVTETVKVIKVETVNVLGVDLTVAEVKLENGSVVSIPDNHWREYTEAA